MNDDSWPSLPYESWKETCETLHMWTQIVGKVKLELTPFLNELWEVGFYPTARGLTTGLIPANGRVFEANFDFITHNLHVAVSDGRVKSVPLIPRSVADFYQEFMAVMRSLGIEVKINTTPSEVPNPIPFEQDQDHASYDADSVHRFWRILIQTSTVLQEYRSPFTGKSSPILFYWGSFDLNETRYSGNPAPPPEGAPHFFQVAEDAENISCGFWPGSVNAAGVALGKPAFYSYTNPAPPGFQDASVRPDKAEFDSRLGEFILLYEDARQTDSPAQTILDFFRSTYEAGANLAGWDRSRLEREPARFGPAATSSASSSRAGP